MDRLFFQLFITTVTGKALSVQAEPSDTIDTVKHKLRSQRGEGLDDQYLAYAGKQLEGGRTLADYGIGQGCTLELSSRLLGGCYYCHDCRFNPRAPAHSSANCKDPKNAFGKASHAAGVRKDLGHHQHTPAKAQTSSSEYGSYYKPSAGVVAKWPEPKCSLPQLGSGPGHQRASPCDVHGDKFSLHQQEPASHPHQQHAAKHAMSPPSSGCEPFASAGGHAAAAAAAWIEEVDTIAHNQAQNSAAVMLVDRREGGPAAFMVQEKNGHWGFVAGKIDRGEGAMTALQREYREEVGGVMPRLDAGQASAPGEPRKFLYHHGNGAATAVYAGFVPEAQLPSPRFFRPNREIRAVRVVPLQQLHAIVGGRHESMTMRPCAVGSTAAVLRAMGLG
jgi:8-oxo-dGTP pyrophosphatase MutT (NUDIX family)